MVLANQGEHFCVGANLLLVVMSASQQQWTPLRDMVKGFQLACQRMKYASVPVVAAPYGMTLGGGLELCLGAGNVQAAAETYAGLVEVGVGLVPGGGGTMNLLWRALEGVPDGATVDTLRARHADLQERGARAGGDERGGGEGLRLLPARRRGELRPRAAADGGEGTRRRSRAERLAPAGAARLRAPGRERDRDAEHDGRARWSKRGRRASTTRRSR